MHRFFFSREKNSRSVRTDGFMISSYTYSGQYPTMNFFYTSRLISYLSRPQTLPVWLSTNPLIRQLINKKYQQRVKEIDQNNYSARPIQRKTEEQVERKVEYEIQKMGERGVLSVLHVDMTQDSKKKGFRQAGGRSHLNSDIGTTLTD